MIPRRHLFDCFGCGSRLDYRYCTFGSSNGGDELEVSEYASALCEVCGTFHEGVRGPGDGVPARVMLWGFQAMKYEPANPPPPARFWEVLAASFDDWSEPWPFQATQSR
jgi:hypothetical protein